MSIHIKGKLPTNVTFGAWFYPSGVVAFYDPYGKRLGESKYEELPPHGRQIDADALVEAIKTEQPYYPLILFGTGEEQKAIYVQKIIEMVNVQPTIIEAEENKSLKDRLAECDASDLFPELTAEEKAENKRLAKDFKGAEGSEL